MLPEVANRLFVMLDVVLVRIVGFVPGHCHSMTLPRRLLKLWHETRQLADLQLLRLCPLLDARRTPRMVEADSHVEHSKFEGGAVRVH